MRIAAYLTALSFLLTPVFSQDADRPVEGDKKDAKGTGAGQDGPKKKVVPEGGAEKVDNPVKGTEEDGKTADGKAPAGRASSGTANEVGPPTRENAVVRPQEFPAIVAVVGNTSISRKELEREYARLSEEYRRKLSLRVDPLDASIVIRDALQGLVDHQLLLQASRRLVGGRDLKEVIPLEKVHEEVDRRVEDLKKAGYRQFSTREDYFTNQIKQFGLTREKFIEGLRERILVNHYLWQEVFRDIGQYIRPSESRSYYRANLSEFTTPLGYSYRRIEFGQDAESSALAREIQKALDRGEDFVELAQQHSEEFSRGSKSNGRLWEKRASEVQEMAFPIPQILTRMTVGQHLGPFKIQGKVVFFRLENVEAGSPLPYEEAQPTIERRLLGRQREAQTQDLLRRLRGQTRIESFLAGIRLKGESELIGDPRGDERGKVSGDASKTEEKSAAGVSASEEARSSAGDEAVGASRE